MSRLRREVLRSPVGRALIRRGEGISAPRASTPHRSRRQEREGVAASECLMLCAVDTGRVSQTTSRVAFQSNSSFQICIIL